MSKIWYSRFLGGCALLVGFPTALAAQTPEAASAAANSQARGSQPGANQTIVVTARRREELMQEVPLAITSLSPDDLADANLTRMEDLSTFVPGVSIAPSQHRNHTPAFAIRGQRQDLNYITNDPSVGIYVAEAVQGRPYGLGQSLFDLESVQVLKGPQGTLFGRNTTGGAILFQPRRPTLGQFDGYAQIRLGNFDLIEAQGAMSLPVGDKAGLRLGFNRMRRHGYVRNVTTGNDLNDEDSYALRAVLLVEPSDNFKNTTYVDYFHADQLGAATRLTETRPGSLADTRDLGGGVTLSDVLAAQAGLGFWETGGAKDGQSRGENFGLTNVMELEVSPLLTIKNVANYRDIKSYEEQNLTGTPLPFLDVVDDQKSDQYSFELQLLGENDSGTLNWILGGYFFREKGTRVTLTSVFGNPPNPRTGIGTNKSYSVFGQADWEIVEKLTVTAGLRYTWDKRNFEQQLVSASTGLCSLCESRSAKFNKLTYTVGLSYQIDEDKLAYFTTRRGYRAGGFNSSANNADALLPFAPETITDYEFGVKADWDLGGAKLRTNIAAFYAEYKDIQRTVIRTVDGIPVTTIFNAAKAHLSGFELETNLWAGDFEFVGSLAYINPVYDDFENGGVDQSGNKFAHIPDWTFRLGARYTAPVGLGTGSTTRFSVDYAWRDSVFHTEFNAPRNFQESYGLLNGRVEFQNIFDSEVDVALWGSNLTNKKYFQSTGDSYGTLGVVYRSLGLPRTYGVEVGIQF